MTVAQIYDIYELKNDFKFEFVLISLRPRERRTDVVNVFDATLSIVYMFMFITHLYILDTNK